MRGIVLSINLFNFRYPHDPTWSYLNVSVVVDTLKPLCLEAPYSATPGVPSIVLPRSGGYFVCKFVPASVMFNYFIFSYCEVLPMFGSWLPHTPFVFAHSACAKCLLGISESLPDASHIQIRTKSY